MEMIVIGSDSFLHKARYVNILRCISEHYAKIYRNTTDLLSATLKVSLRFPKELGRRG